jgi:hypothetical protein
MNCRNFVGRRRRFRIFCTHSSPNISKPCVRSSRPERVLGRYAGASSETVWGDRALALAEVEEKYRQHGKLFRLTQEFDVAWLTAIANGIELHPWEYTHEIATRQGAKKVTMTSPVRWIAAYASDTPVAELKRMLAGKEQRRPKAIPHFVVSTIVLQMVAEKIPGCCASYPTSAFTGKWSRFPNCTICQPPP